MEDIKFIFKRYKYVTRTRDPPPPEPEDNDMVRELYKLVKNIQDSQAVAQSESGIGMLPEERREDFRSALRSDTTAQNSRLRPGSYISIELNTATPIPEWGGKKLFVMFEDDAHLTDDGFVFFRPRQEQFYLIR